MVKEKKRSLVHRRAGSIAKYSHAHGENVFVCTLMGLANLLQILPFVLCNDFPISVQSLP